METLEFRFVVNGKTVSEIVVAPTVRELFTQFRDAHPEVGSRYYTRTLQPVQPLVIFAGAHQ